MNAPRFEPSDDGETVLVVVDAGPLVPPLEYEVDPHLLRDAWITAEARRYGANPFGEL